MPCQMPSTAMTHPSPHAQPDDLARRSRHRHLVADHLAWHRNRPRSRLINLGCGRSPAGWRARPHPGRRSTTSTARTAMRRPRPRIDPPVHLRVPGLARGVADRNAGRSLRHARRAVVLRRRGRSSCDRSRRVRIRGTRRYGPGSGTVLTTPHAVLIADELRTSVVHVVLHGAAAGAESLPWTVRATACEAPPEQACVSPIRPAQSILGC